MQSYSDKPNYANSRIVFYRDGAGRLVQVTRSDFNKNLSSIFKDKEYIEKNDEKKLLKANKLSI